MLPNYLSSYYKYFLDGLTYKESCYSCKYATSDRVGDITIGDYWGIEEEHSDYLTENGGMFDNKKGISCLIINNEIGQILVNNYGDSLLLKESNYQNVSKHNGQLNHPSKITEKRQQIMKYYQEFGYEELEKKFNSEINLITRIKGTIPRNIKNYFRKK